MFEGLSGMDWVLVVTALAFGFGLVKFMMLVHKEPPGVLPASAQVPLGTKTLAWFQVLGVSETADRQEIERAFDESWRHFSAGRLEQLQADLDLIMKGELAPSLQPFKDPSLATALEAAAALASAIKHIQHTMESARDEGLAAAAQAGRSSQDA
jgi:hypothetical protein